MNLFGKKKAAPPPAQDPTVVIASIRNNLDMLDKREQHIQKRIEQAVVEARAKAAKKDKNGALFCLKRKKLYEQEVSKLQGARITLENQALALESASVNIEVFKTVEAGTKAMKQVRGNIDADKIDDLMDDMAEEKETADQISDAISRPAQDLFDDEELMNELAELEELELDEQLMAAPAAAPARTPASVSASASTAATLPAAPTSVFNLPTAPTSSIAASSAATAQESEEEAALRELQASMMA